MSGDASAGTGTGAGGWFASVRDSVASGMRHLINSDGDLNTMLILEKIGRVLVAVVIMWVAHAVGSHIRQRISAYMRNETSKRNERLKKQEDSVALRSRNELARIGGMVVYILCLAVGFLVVLRVLGVEVATIVALLSTIGVAIGFAVQGTLSDVAAGILLALFQTYEAGDIIRLNEHEGRVIDFHLINTLLQDVSTLTLMTVPNRVIQDSVVVNYSRSYYHMYQFFVLVSNRQPDKNNTIDRILGVIRDDIDTNEERFPDLYRKDGRKSSVSVHGMDGPGTRLSVKVYLEPDAIPGARSSTRTGVRKTCEENGIKLLDKL